MGQTPSQPVGEQPVRTEIGPASDSDSPPQGDSRPETADSEGREVPAVPAPIWSAAVGSSYGDPLIRSLPPPVRYKKRRSLRTDADVMSPPSAQGARSPSFGAEIKLQLSGELDGEDYVPSAQRDPPAMASEEADVKSEPPTQQTPKRKKKKKGDKGASELVSPQELNGTGEPAASSAVGQDETALDHASKKKKKRSRKNRESLQEDELPSFHTQPDSSLLDGPTLEESGVDNDETIIPSSPVLSRKRKSKAADGERKPRKKRAASAEVDGDEIVEDSFPREVVDAMQRTADTLKAERLSPELQRMIREVVTDEAERIYPSQASHREAEPLDPRDIKAEPEFDLPESSQQSTRATQSSTDISREVSEADRLDSLPAPSYDASPKAERSASGSPGSHATSGQSNNRSSGGSSVEQDAQMVDELWGAHLSLRGLKQSQTDDEAEDEDSGHEDLDDDEYAKSSQDLGAGQFILDEADEADEDDDPEDIVSDEELASGDESRDQPFDDIEDIGHSDGEEERFPVRGRKSFDDIEDDDLHQQLDHDGSQQTSGSPEVREAGHDAMDIDVDGAEAEAEAVSEERNESEEPSRGEDDTSSSGSSGNEELAAKRAVSPLVNGTGHSDVASGDDEEDLGTGSDKAQPEEAVAVKGQQGSTGSAGDEILQSKHQRASQPNASQPNGTAVGEQAASEDTPRTRNAVEGAFYVSSNKQPRSAAAKETPFSGSRRRPKPSFFDRSADDGAAQPNKDGPSSEQPVDATPSRAPSGKAASSTAEMKATPSTSKAKATNRRRSKLSETMNGGDAETPAGSNPRTPRPPKTPKTPISKDGTNMGPWTQEETEALEREVEAIKDRHNLSHFDFAERVQAPPSKSDALQMETLMVCTEAVPTRNRRQVKEKLRSLYHNFTGTNKYLLTDEEKEELHEQFELYGTDFAKIGQIMNRDKQAIRDYYRHHYVCEGKMKIGPWAPEEEDRLREAVIIAIKKIRESRKEDSSLKLARKHGGDDTDLVDWQQISEAMGRTRNRAQCLWKCKDMRDKGEFNIKAGSTPAPRDVSVVLATAREDIESMTPEDMYRLVLAISESGVEKDGQIPWRDLVDEQFRKKWARPTRKLLWHRLRKSLPDCHEHGVKDNARRLLSHFDARGEFPHSRGFIDDDEEERIITYHKPGERKWVQAKDTESARKQRRRRSRSRSRSTDRDARSTASRELDSIQNTESSDDETIPAGRSENGTPRKTKGANRRSTGATPRGRSVGPAARASNKGKPKALSEEFIVDADSSDDDEEETDGVPDKPDDLELPSVPDGARKQPAPAPAPPKRRALPEAIASDNESLDLGVDMASLNNRIRGRIADGEVEDSDPESGRPPGSVDLSVSGGGGAPVYHTVRGTVNRLKRVRRSTPSDVDVSQFKKQKKRKRKTAKGGGEKGEKGAASGARPRTTSFTAINARPGVTARSEGGEAAAKSEESS